jgi:hypothetical protein
VYLGERPTGRIGIINTRGEIAVPFEYDQIGGGDLAFAFDNGLVILGINSEDEADEHGGRPGPKWGMVDMNGYVLLPFEYDRIARFGGVNGREYYWVLKGDLWGIYTVSS